MKRYILTCLLGVAFTTCVTAQSAPVTNPRVQFGISLGGNLSNLLSSDSSLNAAYRWRMRFFAGVSQQTAFGKFFVLRTEINYEGMGTSYEVALVNQTGDSIGFGRYQYSLHYARVPVLAKFRFGKNIKGYVETGPYLGVLIVAKEGLDEEPKNLFNFPNLTVSDGFARFDAGLILGGGVEIPLFNEHELMFGIRYSQGFIDASRESAREWNGAFNFHFGYLFQL